MAFDEGSTVPRDAVMVSEWRDWAPVSVSGGGSASSDEDDAGVATGLASLGNVALAAGGPLLGAVSFAVLGTAAPSRREPPHAAKKKKASTTRPVRGRKAPRKIMVHPARGWSVRL